MPKNKVISTNTFNGHPVVSPQKYPGAYKYSNRHLQNNQDLLNSVIARHNKVLSFRMDLKFPADYSVPADNEIIKKAMSTYTKELSREGLDPQYAVKREQKTSEHQHYHVHMFVDGNKKVDCMDLIDMAVPHWSRALKVDDKTADDIINRCNKSNGKPQKNGIMIRRNSPEYKNQYDQTFRQMSYLAKKDDDDITPQGEKAVFYSQFRRGKSRSKK